MDLELLRLLSQYKLQKEAAETQPHLAGENLEEGESLVQEVKVFITVKENLDSLRRFGFEPQLTFGNVAAGKISLEEIEKIAELSDVVQIETSKPHFFMLDTSTKEIGANLVRSISGNTWSGIATGKGVIVAIIDSGINYEHRSFRNADGSSRVIAILDLSLNGNAPPHPDGGKRPDITINFGNQEFKIIDGIQYTRDNIRAALAPGGPKLRHEDSVGHGTHTAGIAAGNGFQRDHCKRFYPGVAPEADILIVKLGTVNIEHDILAGVAFAIHIAEQENKAVAINLSSSRDVAGAHDGNSNLERTIDFMLDNHPSNKNVSLVAIAGNTADKDTHATGNVPPGPSVSFEFQISNNILPKLIDIWYSGANNNMLGCRVRPAVVPPIDEVLPGPAGQPLKFDIFGGGKVEISSRIQPNNFQNISIGIIPPRLGFNPEMVVNNWRIELRNLAAAGPAIEFHAWGFFIEGGRPTVQFKSHKSKDSTVGIPGTARNVITVGSFNESGGGLSGFSGRGPTIDNRQKPDITAPGNGITSADNDLPGCCRRFWCVCCNVYHTEEVGTSAAAPHVAGAIALMLELNDGLTRDQVKAFIMDNARKDNHTGPNPSNLWGAGKLNVAASVNAVNATLPTPRTIASGQPDFVGQPRELLGISESKLMEIQERFMNSPGGRFYYALAEKYLDEIRDLINGNKKVATIWRRNDGPLMLRLGLRAVLKPDDPLPRKINDLSVRDRLARIAGIIRRFATGSLAADIDLHLPFLFQMEGKSINQIMSILESKDIW